MYISPRVIITSYYCLDIKNNCIIWPINAPLSHMLIITSSLFYHILPKWRTSSLSKIVIIFKCQSLDADKQNTSENILWFLQLSAEDKGGFLQMAWRKAPVVSRWLKKPDKETWKGSRFRNIILEFKLLMIFLFESTKSDVFSVLQMPVLIISCVFLPLSLSAKAASGTILFPKGHLDKI